MRKSLIKFGSSFGSSFHLSKDEKIEKIEKKEKERKAELDLEFILEQKEKKEEKSPKTSHKKKIQIEHHDEINKKFD